MIRSVEMRNFKSHKHLAVSFMPGLNVIQGENAAGKSNLIKAILYALFGTVVSKRAHLQTWGSDQPMSVTLKVDLNGHGLVTIERSHRSATICSSDGALRASGQAPVTSFIQSELGMDFTTFKDLLLARQGDTQALLKMGSAGLQKRLEAIAQVGIVDSVLELVGKDAAQTGADLKALGDLPNLNSLNDEVDKLYSTSRQLNTEVETLKQQTQDAKELAAGLTSRLREDLYLSRDKLSTLKERESTLKSHKEFCAVRLSGLAAAKPALEPILMKSSLKAAQDNLSEARADLAKRESVERLLELTRDQLKAASDKLDKSMKTVPLVKEGNRLKAARELANTRAKEAADEYRHLEEHPASCPTCNRPYDESTYDDSVKQLEAAKVKYEVLHKESVQRTNEWEAFFKSAGLSPDTYDKQEAWADMHRQDAAKSEAAMKDVQVRANTMTGIKELERRAMGWESKVNEYLADLDLCGKWQSDYDAAQAADEFAAGQLFKVSQDLAALPPNLTELITQAEAELQQATEQYHSSDNELAGKSVQLAVAGKDLESTKALLESGRAAHDKAQKLILFGSQLGDLGIYLRKNRARFMEDVWEGLTHYASHLASSVTDGKISGLSRSADGEFTVTETVPDMPVDELSGAGQSIVGLCLRIALANTFYGDSGFLLLDEVTADCSEENSARVAGMLQSLKAQVITITHRNSDAMNASNVILL